MALQWGRRVNATETKAAAETSRVAAALQWGRRVNATETRTRPIRPRTLPPDRFNGAVA